MRQLDLIPFFAMAYLIAWGILALYMFASETMVRLFGSLTGHHPLFYLAVYAPAIAALTLVLCRHGIDGTRRFLSRLLLWRTSIQWYVLMIVVVPLVFYVAALLQRGRIRHAVSISISAELPGSAAADGNQGPIEEIGWRGLALPLLQRRAWHPYGLRWCWVSSGLSGIFRPFCSAAHRKVLGR